MIDPAPGPIEQLSQGGGNDIDIDPESSSPVVPQTRDEQVADRNVGPTQITADKQAGAAMIHPSGDTDTNTGYGARSSRFHFTNTSDHAVKNSINTVLRARWASGLCYRLSCSVNQNRRYFCPTNINANGVIGHLSIL
jgi:hypothetical protein